MSKEMLNALNASEAEKGTSKEIMIDALEAALVPAYKRHYDQTQNVEVEFDQKKGKIYVHAVKEVMEEVMDPQLEASLKDALLISPAYEIGGMIRFEVTPKDFGQIIAQAAEQVILQHVREAERAIIYNEFSTYERDIMQGIAERRDKRYTYVNLDKIEVILSKQDQMPNESYQPHDRIKVYASRVENTSKDPQVFASRNHPDLLRRLFEQEVPEVHGGIVETVSTAHEADDRSKMAARSDDPNIDTVGTHVGPKGQRTQTTVNESKGKNMGIVEWNEDPAVPIANALDPAQVMDVIFSGINPKACTVTVSDYQLSLAIGKRGQNARLTAKLTNHRIDIKSEPDMMEFCENQEQQKETEELHDEAIIQSDLTDDGYETTVLNSETVKEKPEA